MMGIIRAVKMVKATVAITAIILSFFDNSVAFG
jgi:hypothetical protein